MHFGVFLFVVTTGEPHAGGLNETPTEHALISYENISYIIIIKSRGFIYFSFYVLAILDKRGSLPIVRNFHVR